MNKVRRVILTAILSAAFAFAALYVVEANWFGLGEPLPCRRAYLPWLPRVHCTEMIGNIFLPDYGE
jgi:hypothetical protein